jgi:hypothetical protein
MLNLFGRKKAQAPPTVNSDPAVHSRLQEITGTDAELQQVMSKLLFLDPKKITTPLDQVLSQAAQLESSGSRMRAEISYRIAGGIALYKQDVDGVRKFFEKASSLAGDSRPEYKTIAKRAEDAVNVAKKYYETA